MAASTLWTGFVSERPADQALKPRSDWALSWPLAVALMLFTALMVVNAPLLLADPDSHWHIAIGRWILERGTVPTIDTHSHSFYGEPWIAKEWLSQVVMATVFDAAGWGGLVVFAALMLAVSFGLMARLLLRDVGPLVAVGFAVAAAIMTAPHFLARPHIIAFPFMLLWVAGLVRAVEERRTPPAILLLAMLAWANLHGGFTLGLMLAAAFALEALLTEKDDAHRRTLFFEWAKFGIAAGLVSCITPYGAESILVTVRIFSLDDALPMISEWRSPDFQTQQGQLVIILVGLYFALSRGVKLPLFRTIFVVGLTYLYFKYARNAELLAMLAPLIVAPVLARQWPSLVPDWSAAAASFGQRLTQMGRPAGSKTLVMCCVAMLAVGALVARFGDLAPPKENTPDAALQFVRDNGISGRVFNHYGFGGFLIREGVPTFIDGRGELFGGAFIKAYVEVASLRGKEPLETLLDRHKIEWTLLLKDQAANRLLERLPGWRHAYTDDTATIFVRERP